MSRHSNAITIREADSRDNQELLALTQLAPMNGVIGLRIDRFPDFQSLCRLRGDTKTFVATGDGRVIGSMSVACRDVFLEGRRGWVGAVNDFKVHPSFRGSRAALKLMLTATEYGRSRQVDLACCVVAEGNESMLPVLRQPGRCGTPKFINVGKFLVYQILPCPLQLPTRGYEVAEATERDFTELSRFCNEFNQLYDLAPILTEHTFHEAEGMTMRTLVAREKGEVVATLCVCDTSRAKQTVVVKMPKLLDLGVRALRIPNKLIPLYAFPRVGDQVRLLHVRHMAFRKSREGALRLLLQRVRHEAFRGRYSFLSVGIHERDPLRSVFRGLPRYPVLAQGFVASLFNDEQLVSRVLTRIPAEDFALV